MRLLAIAAIAACLVVPVIAAAQGTKPGPLPKSATTARPPSDPNMVIRASSNSVTDTINKLVTAVEGKGAKVVARVDHAAGAKSVGTDMRPSEVLMFGNPKLGTPVMTGNVRAGLDLPLKVLAWEDAAGKVWVGYTKPAVLQSRYRLAGKEQAANIKAIADALDGLTAAAIAK